MVRSVRMKITIEEMKNAISKHVDPRVIHMDNDTFCYLLAYYPMEIKWRRPDVYLVHDLEIIHDSSVDGYEIK